MTTVSSGLPVIRIWCPFSTCSGLFDASYRQFWSWIQSIESKKRIGKLNGISNLQNSVVRISDVLSDMSCIEKSSWWISRIRSIFPDLPKIHFRLTKSIDILPVKSLLVYQSKSGIKWPYTDRKKAPRVGLQSYLSSILSPRIDRFCMRLDHPILVVPMHELALLSHPYPLLLIWWFVWSHQICLRSTQEVVLFISVSFPTGPIRSYVIQLSIKSRSS